MNKIDYIKANFKDYYIDNGPENGILKGTKYAGCATHCRACVNTLVRMFKPKTFLEIGSWKYESSIAASNAMDEYTDEGVIDSLEIKKGGYNGGGIPLNLNKRIRPNFWYPHHTPDGDWRYTDPDIVFKDFKTLSDEEIYNLNIDILKNIAPKEGYDLIFIDGDHSYEGISWDWKYVEMFANKDALIVIDNIWDIRLKEVRRFFDEIKTHKWDFEEWNDSHKKCNMVQDTGVVILE